MTDSIKHPVIFDTDPGVDDAMALCFAMAHPLIDLVGITTVYGNVTVSQATTNALYLTQLAGRGIAVAQGASTPWVKLAEAPPDYIHGADGLGNLPSRIASSAAKTDARSAAQFIVDMARAQPGLITLVPVGPLTNIAAALALEPKLPQLIKRIVLMGGAVKEGGNVSPVAEANIWNDPHAADAVFTAGFDLTMVGLDVTYNVVIPVSLFEKLAAHHQHALTDTLLHAVRFYAQFYATRYPDLKANPGCFGHDVLAFIAFLHPELFSFAQGRLRCVSDGIAQGQTILHDRLQVGFPQAGFGEEVPLSKAAMTVDVPSVLKIFENTLLSKWL
ncbi:nucleoside hydrolase [Variovorax sp. PCZ-1]|uniref:nucleoside hydrolase n=1 Tax=Variovorax sp. PCZ-1 TaxID=2835533 RepID=UPI001BCE4FB3|nr:nucleoside hydrolase [Variovorax sp. PCZ-1]MBS7806594.1 nucleoside hydrolase [Variovorax sp. PCZ-1]